MEKQRGPTDEQLERNFKSKNNFAVVRVFGVFLTVLGLIFGFAWSINRYEATRFANGLQIEGTIERIHEGDPPLVMVSFVDRNGRSQTWHLEKMTQSLRETLAAGDEIVAVQMLDSPSRIMLLEQVENRPNDAGGLVATAVFLLPGLFLALQKRPYGSPPPSTAHNQTTAATGCSWMTCPPATAWHTTSALK